jgi:hypothetical protein
MKMLTPGMYALVLIGTRDLCVAARNPDDWVSALKRSTEVVTYREGAAPTDTRKLPGRTDYEAITLERNDT